MLGTSITPAREACLRLVSERGLELRSGRFVVVPPLTLARYMEVRTIRLELEGLATQLAAQNASGKDIEQLSAIQDAYVVADHAGDAEKAFALNREFHFALYRLGKMEMLVAHIESLWVSMGPMLTVYFREGQHRYVGGEQHARVIEALKVHDGAAARAAIVQDIIQGGEDFLRFLRDNPEFSVE